MEMLTYEEAVTELETQKELETQIWCAEIIRQSQGKDLTLIPFNSAAAKKVFDIPGHSAKPVSAYCRLATNVCLATGLTVPKSRETLSKEMGISRSTWYRTEKKLRDAGVITYPENHSKRYAEPTRFILPYAIDPIDSIQRHYEKQHLLLKLQYLTDTQEV